VSGVRANLAVKVFGPDLEQLRAAAKQAEAIMKPIPGLVDVASSSRPRSPSSWCDPSRPSWRPSGCAAAIWRASSSWPSPARRWRPGTRAADLRRRRQAPRPLQERPSAARLHAHRRTRRALHGPGFGGADRRDHRPQPDQPRECRAAHRGDRQRLRPRPARRAPRRSRRSSPSASRCRRATTSSSAASSRARRRPAVRSSGCLWSRWSAWPCCC
jgi:hypothetical protein